MAGNPFRRSQGSRLPDESTHRKEPDAPNTPPPPKSRTKKKKRVVFQTPPRTPEEPSIPRRLSDGLAGSPPPPLAKLGDDDTDSTTTADSDLEQALVNTRRNSGSLATPATSFGAQSGSRAPFNPFARTLETSEARFGLGKHPEERTAREEVDGSDPATPRARKPMLDVDVFKNILMGGGAAPTPPIAAQQQPQQRPQDSSSTDTSSVSAQSIFDPMHEAHPESPRTSFDDHRSDSDEAVDDESSSLMGPVASRPVEEGPPRPPKQPDNRISRAYPQTVSFADFDNFTPTAFPPSAPRTPPVNTPLQAVMRPLTPKSSSSSDLNKPLPPPPAEQGTYFPVTDVPQSDAMNLQPLKAGPAAAGVLPQSKKAPPPPPNSRRQNQAGSGEGRDRSTSNLSQGSVQPAQLGETDATTRATDQSLKPAPPPPPSRRSQPALTTPSPAAEMAPRAPLLNPGNPEPKVMPPPPPRRQPGKSGTSLHRTPSNASRTSLPRSDSFTAATASGQAPPAPPPRRGGSSKRDSIDGGPPNSMTTRRVNEPRRASGQSFESERSISITSLSLKQVDEPGEVEEVAKLTGHSPPAMASAQSDILADMSAFQAEIDALRAQTSRGV
ncbi:hypothetical protein LTR08_005578 [Meristemomyces frigidus]|nr:hypothetical protein LTR08_005578 [Meristemomyces frigidus]